MNFFKDVIIWLALIFPKENALEMANLFYESGLFEFASPSLSGAGNVDCINEPLFEAGSLWHLGNNLTKSYVHVNYCKSRTIISQGSSDVIVAIIDTGVDVSHRDLYNVLPWLGCCHPNYSESCKGGSRYNGCWIYRCNS